MNETTNLDALKRSLSMKLERQKKSVQETEGQLAAIDAIIGSQRKLPLTEGSGKNK